MVSFRYPALPTYSYKFCHNGKEITWREAEAWKTGSWEGPKFKYLVEHGAS
jgi:hypothetical protein